MTPHHLSKHHARSVDSTPNVETSARPTYNQGSPTGNTPFDVSISRPCSYMQRDTPLDPRIAEILLENNNILRVEREKRFNEVVALIMTNQRDITQIRQEMNEIRQELAAVRGSTPTIDGEKTQGGLD